MGVDEYPLLPIMSRQVWTVKTSNQLEKPRFVILGFQTNRKDQRAVNASQFYHCNLTNVKLFLNSQSYPYGNVEKVSVSCLHALDSDRLLKIKRVLEERSCRHTFGI